MKSREQIINSMCYTFRHDYGLEKDIGNGFISAISCGMTREEREALWNQMAQIFDNDIALELEDYRRLQEGEAVVVPKDREHAEALVRVGMFYLENNK